MTYPSGVQTSTLTFSNPITFTGTPATRTEITIQSTAGVVWTATGQPIDDFPEIIAPGEGLPGSLTAPFVDQEGFTDQAGNDFTMWAYVIKRKSFYGGLSKTVTKAWAPIIGQSTIDFDNLPGGSVGLPVSAPPVPVTSVASLTGVVVAEDLAGELVPYIPSDAEKLDVTTAATTYAAKSVETSKADASVLTAHTGNVSNPHAVTKAQVGLGSVDNTADTAKPVSTLQAAALGLKQDAASLDAAAAALLANPASALAGAGNATYAKFSEGAARALGWAIITDPQWAGGADPTGVADSAAAINAAITASLTVYAPAGTYLISSTQIRPRVGTRILGSGMRSTTFKAASGLATAVILGVSGTAAANVELRDFGIDCNFSGGATVGAGAQMSNAPEFRAWNVYVRNGYGGGILLQGFGAAPNGCPRSVIENCRLDSLGLANGSTGHGVTIAGQSDHSRVMNSTFTNIVGGMGVAVDGSSSGNPEHCTVSGNTITMAASTIGFEGIGFDVNSPYAVITGNNVTNSQDNGISATGPHSTVVGNVVDGALNHGIWAASYSTVTGNTVRNCGKAFLVDGALYGGVALDGSTGAIVVGNTLLDDQGTQTMAHLVKMVGTTGGGNNVGPNVGSGWSQASPYSGLTATTDVLLDTNTNPAGITLSRIYGPAGSPLTFQTGVNALSQFWVGNTSSGIAAQFGARTNLTTRPTIAAQIVSGQTADLYQGLDISGNPTWHVGPKGAMFLARTAQTLASNGTVTVDASTGNIQTITLGANATATTITNPTTGQQLTLTFIQDGTGSRSYAWPTGSYAGSGAPTNRTAPNARDTVTMQYDGTTWNETSRSQQATSGVVTDALGWGLCTNTGASPFTVNNTFPVANTTLYFRLVGGGVPITKGRVRVAVQSGNIAIAFYSNTGTGLSAAPGTLLASSGSVACPAVGTADLALGATITPNSGDWVAIWADNTTVSMNGPSSSSLASALFAGRAYTHASDTTGPPTTPASLASGYNKFFEIVGVP